MNKHTAQIDGDKWIIKNASGEIVAEFRVDSPMQDIASVLRGLDAGTDPANVLFPGIFEEE